jgi:hypothetical protein
MFIVSMETMHGLENSYQPIPRFASMQYRSTHPSGFALGFCASIVHTNLGSWLITITNESV